MNALELSPGVEWPNMKSQTFKHNIIALVYDFDGTLTPGSMQDYTILPALGIKPTDFWKKVEKESILTKGESTLTYMRLLLEACERKDYKFTSSELKRLATKLRFFQGVAGYFGRMNAFIKKEFRGKISARHYIISGGLKDIIEATPIAKNIHRVFACEYYFDKSKRAVFPKVIVNDTLKTQFLFRISKGMENISENINEHMPRKDLAIPFQNILYIGDGMTDVPCMAVTKQLGGHSLAVYRPDDPKGLRVCQSLLGAKRADFIAKADFRSSSELEKIIKIVIRNMATGIAYRREAFMQQSVHLYKK